MQDPLVIGGHSFQSRSILGSGKFSLDLIQAVAEQGGAHNDHTGFAASRHRRRCGEFRRIYSQRADPDPRPIHPALAQQKKRCGSTPYWPEPSAAAIL